MKRFFIMLNNFLNVREYERRVKVDKGRLASELRYVEDMLVDECENDIGPQRQAAINMHCYLIKEKRRKEKEWRGFSYPEFIKNR